MITLPSRWRTYVRVNLQTKALFLHFRNDAQQYFTYYRRLDPALPLDDILEQIAQRDWSAEQAYMLDDGLQTIRLEPTDQNWHPAPLPGESIYSLEQYRASMKEKPDVD